MPRLIFLFLLLLVLAIGIGLIVLVIIKRITAVANEEELESTRGVDTSSDRIILVAAVIALVASFILFFIN